jgi:hypothetical protein
MVYPAINPKGNRIGIPLWYRSSSAYRFWNAGKKYDLTSFCKSKIKKRLLWSHSDSYKWWPKSVPDFGITDAFIKEVENKS